jgi:predicted Zn-dependent peptidase
MAHYPDADALDRILAAVDTELADLAQNGPADGELDRVRTRLGSELLRQLDAVLNRTLEVAKFELVHGRAELVNEMAARIAAVDEEQVRAAAAALAPERRAVLEVIAGGAQ